MKMLILYVIQNSFSIQIASVVLLIKKTLQYRNAMLSISIQCLHSSCRLCVACSLARSLSLYPYLGNVYSYLIWICLCHHKIRQRKWCVSVVNVFLANKRLLYHLNNVPIMVHPIYNWFYIIFICICLVCCILYLVDIHIYCVRICYLFMSVLSLYAINIFLDDFMPLVVLLFWNNAKYV